MAVELLVRPACANSAAARPFCAARPGCRLLAMLPNISRNPDACVAASPSAQTVCVSSSCNKRALAAAAPNTPAVEVMCQPTS